MLTRDQYKFLLKIKKAENKYFTRSNIEKYQSGLGDYNVTVQDIYGIIKPKKL